MTDAKGMTVLADQADRERILTDLDTNLLVEAGAGSGKTTSLVGRLLALIESGVRVQEIAAITFTNKASDEMKERFRLALEKAHREAATGDADGAANADSSDGLRSSELRKQRLADAIANLDLVFIGTIHSFCGALLRERPIESGLDPSFEELDEDGDRAFRERCWDDYLAELGGEERVRLEELLRLGVDVNTLRDVYERVSYFADVEVPVRETAMPDFDRIRVTLFPLLELAARYLPQTEPPAGWDTVQKLVRQSRQKLKYMDPSDDMRLLELIKDFDRKLDVTLNRWTSKEWASEMKQRFPEWQRDVLAPFLREWREFLYPKLIGFVRPALEYGRERRYAAGKLNFQDLLMEAAKLLREHPEVRAYFARRYTRLLVDEFQDTDPIQAELMFLLTGEAAQEGQQEGTHVREWRKLTPRQGSLFVVGDPKQSIYRFRRADISIYNEVKSRIGACGAVLRLTANFRSVHAIGDFVNGQFVGKLPPEETVQQAAFVLMETRKSNPTDGRRSPHGIYALSYPKLPGGKAAAAQQDAERIAAYVAWACGIGSSASGGKAARGGGIQIADGAGSRPAVPSDFLILTKTREFLHLYAEQLDLLGIPSDTSGSVTVYEELLALWQLAKTLDDPADSPALLAVLRGMMFGISDRALYVYKRAAGVISLHRLIEELECPDEALPVRAALMRLRTYRDWIRGSSSAIAVFTRIVDDLGLLPYVSTLSAGSIRAGTLVRLMQLLQSDPLAAASWPALCRAIGERLTDRGMETSSLHAGGGGAVRIMNLHKAKGLEAPVVFLACPCGETDHDATEYIDRSGEVARGYFTISRKVGEYKSETVAQPPGWEEMNERERLFSNAEKDRLLYVAATRPKQMLVVSLYPEQPAKCPWTHLMEGMELARELDVPESVMGAAREMMEQARDDGAELPYAAAEAGAGKQKLVKIAGSPDGTPDLIAIEAERRQTLERLGTPSYELASVTALTKSTAAKPEWSATGRGLAFGSVVHRAIELAGRGLAAERLQDAVRMLAAEEGLEPKHIDEADAALRVVLASGLWQRSLLAKRRLFEVPLLIKSEAVQSEGLTPAEEQTPGSQPAAAVSTAHQRQRLLRGVIDFLFEEEDGWVIADFKTDSVPDGKLQSFVDFYSPQVLAYAKEWSETFGYPVKEAGLYFVGTGMYVQVGESRSDAVGD